MQAVPGGLSRVLRLDSIECERAPAAGGNVTAVLRRGTATAHNVRKQL